MPVNWMSPWAGKPSGEIPCHLAGTVVGVLRAGRAGKMCFSFSLHSHPSVLYVLKKCFHIEAPYESVKHQHVCGGEYGVGRILLFFLKMLLLQSRQAKN